MTDRPALPRRASLELLRAEASDELSVLIEERIRAHFLSQPDVKAALPGIEAGVGRGELSASRAADDLAALMGV